MSEPDWERIETFIGYGRLDAPIVFIGMEEGLADPSALAADLALRSQFEPVMDLEEAHRGIADGEALFSDKPRRQPTWRVMADLMLQFEGKTLSSAEQRKVARTLYRAKSLGRSNGKSLLTELLPYPHKKKMDWLYTDRFSTREIYEEEMAPPRLALLGSRLADAPRKAIVCYGRGDWQRYKKLFPEVRWSEVGRYACAEWNGVPITLTDHFSTKHFNTNSQLDDLAAVVLRGST